MRPLVIAHRGGSAYAPENTLCAFAGAIDLGADGAELDVHLTRDEEVVVHHDYCLNPDLSRDVEGKWLQAPGPRICDLPYSDLARYKVGCVRPGSSYARRHPGFVQSQGERIPLLSDVVVLAKKASRPFRLFVELKSSLFDPSLCAPPEALARATVAVLKTAGTITGSAVIGFDWRGLRVAKKLEPSLECWFSTYPRSWFGNGTPPHDHEPPPEPALQAFRTWERDGNAPWAAGFDSVRYGGSVVRAMKAAGADGWFPHFSDATEETVREAHACGLKVCAWTVDELSTMRLLASRGIDAVCTDHPQLALASFNE